MTDTSVRPTVVIVAALVLASAVSVAVTGGLPGKNSTPGGQQSSDLPSWKIADICAGDSAGGQCRLLESEALRTLSGGWNVVPQDVRKICIDRLTGPYDKSFRLLSQCLEEQVLRSLDKKVIDTATTADRAAATNGKATPGAAAGQVTDKAETGFAVLPTTSTAALFAAREAWGKGPEPRKVAAPLAKGAVVPLPPDTGRKIVAPAGETIVHPLVATPAAELTPVPADRISEALASLFATREGWGTGPASGGSSTSKSSDVTVAGYPALPTAATDDLIAYRERWGAGVPGKAERPPLARGAKWPLPKDEVRASSGPAGEPIVHALEASPAPAMTPVAPAAIEKALQSLLAERESWGTEPSGASGTDSAASGSYDVLPTTSTDDLIAARSKWGKGPQAGKIAAPLAKGAAFPLPKERGYSLKAPPGKTIVHEYQPTPAAELTPIAGDKIATALSALLAERASWGDSPSKTIGYPLLPTTSTADLIAVRETWGPGPAPTAIKAPLAAGAVSPLPKDTTRRTAGPAGDPIIRPLAATPVPQLTPVPQGQIADALKKLLAEREGWLNAPAGNVAAASNGATAPSNGATVAGYPALPTTATSELITFREKWGGGEAQAVEKPPLAKGAQWPLPKDEVRTAKGPAGEPIVHALEATPAADLTPIPAAQIDAAMKALLAEREGWGSSPAQGGGGAATSDGVNVAGYPALPTTATGDLIAFREKWGGGTPADVGRPRLAKGAQWPLPKDEVRTTKGPAGEPIMHALEATPAPSLTPVPAGQIDAAMKALLAERSGWGTAPSKVAEAKPRSAEAANCEVALRKAAAAGVIRFRTGSAQIDAASNATLSNLAKVAQGCSKGRIRVEGHTDSVGRAEFNKRLSESRAKAVADFLVTAGVAKGRVEAVGYGPDNPVASNDTADGRARNRRIEFTVTD